MESNNNIIGISEAINREDSPKLSDNRIASLRERIRSVGLWNPLHLNAEDTVVKDERDQHVAAALKALGVDELEIIYSSESHHLAVPADKYSINDDLARKAAKLHQGGHAATADYIVSFIEERVCCSLPESEQPPSGDDGNVPVKLLNILDNVYRSDRKQDWPYTAEVKRELETLLATVELSPSRAREYAQAYLESHEEDLEKFRQEEISLKMLNVRRRIRDSEIPDHIKELLIEWSDEEEFNAPQLTKLLAVAETGFTELLDEVLSGKISPHRAKQIASKATEKDLSQNEQATLLRKIRQQEKDIDEYLEQKLPDALENRFNELIEGDWLDENTVERYRKEIASRHEHGEDTSDIFESLQQWKEEYNQLPDLPEEIPESRYENELGKALSHEQNRENRAKLQNASNPEETFEELKQKHEEERTEATPKEKRLEARLKDVHTVSDGVWARSLAERDPTIHKAPPLVDRRYGNIQVFFHKAQSTATHDGMEEEISESSVDLCFFSPPYYTQRGMKLDYLREVETVDDPHEDELTEEEIDAGFEIYLDEMMEIFQAVYDTLKPHRYFLLNISDHQVKTDGSAPNKRYPISEYLVSQIHTNLSRRLPSDQKPLQYVGRLSWYKTFSGVKRASLFFEDEQTSGLPLYYYPEDRVEDIYIFRKGDSNPGKAYKEVMGRFDRDFSSMKGFQRYIRYEDQRSLFENAFPPSVSGKEFSEMYKTDLWVIPPASDGHWAGFPLSLPKLVIQLFSLPGDRIVDPTVGFGTTLKAVQELNQDSPHEVKREGLGWEDFSGEQTGQPDYLEELTRVLSTKDNQPYRSI